MVDGGDGEDGVDDVGEWGDVGVVRWLSDDGYPAPVHVHCTRSVPFGYFGCEGRMRRR